MPLNNPLSLRMFLAIHTFGLKAQRLQGFDPFPLLVDAEQKDVQDVLQIRVDAGIGSDFLF
jgi:hypothetical protein